VRCWLGAGGSAVTQPMLTKLNVGWTYTLLACLCCVCSIPLILAERRWGMKWRREREQKLQKKKLRRQAEMDQNEAQDVEVRLSSLPGTSDNVRHQKHSKAIVDERNEKDWIGDEQDFSN